MYAFVKRLFVVAAASAAQGFALNPLTDVIFHLYTRGNPTLSQPLLATTGSIMSSTMFSPGRPTIFTVHSYDDSAAGNYNGFLVPAFITTEDVNLIAVDWRRAAEQYANALGNAPQVGRIIAQFINILDNDFDYRPSLVRIVGVGLGGHIAGIAARNVNGDIPHITAIDPSLIGWTHHPECLNPNDANVVEVLHATAGLQGYDYPLGDLDFYPNGGSHQTGCADSSCSEIYAYAFYAESITRQVNGGNMFVGTACETYEEAISQRCSGPRDIHFGGTENKTGSSGIYWFSTNIAQPFARG